MNTKRCFPTKSFHLIANILLNSMFIIDLVILVSTLVKTIIFLSCCGLEQIMWQVHMEKFQVVAMLI